MASFESRLADEMTRLITRYGGVPLVAPSMREIPLQNNTEVLQFGEHLLAHQFDMVILLTGVGTRTMVQVLQTRHPRDTIKAALARVSLVARGPKPIAALKELDLAPDIAVPEPNTWRDILQALDARKALSGLRIAVQEYGISNTELLEALRERGAQVSRIPVYRWALPEDTAPLRQVLDAILAGNAEVVLITNAVQVDHVIQLLEQGKQVEGLRPVIRRMVVASVGPIASERLRSFDLPVDLEPSHPKMGILVKETSEKARAILQVKRSATT
ncbi:MAG: uroporphyrinogen-III synthase [Nitrospirota bacterium]